MVRFGGAELLLSSRRHRSVAVMRSDGQWRRLAMRSCCLAPQTVTLWCNDGGRWRGLASRYLAMSIEVVTPLIDCDAIRLSGAGRSGGSMLMLAVK